MYEISILTWVIYGCTYCAISCAEAVIVGATVLELLTEIIALATHRRIIVWKIIYENYMYINHLADLPGLHRLRQDSEKWKINFHKNPLRFFWYLEQ